MTYAIMVRQHGGSENLLVEDITLAAPLGNQVHVKHHAIGLNFIDVYHRTGLYPVDTPFIPGLEAAGEIIAIGPDVQTLKIGDRVAYPGGPMGAYASERLMPETALVKIPDGLDYETAAAMMLKGCTTEYLIRRTFKVHPEHTVLFHAAAGGVGQIATQWLKAIGCTLIATAGGPDKCQLVKDLGADHVIDYQAEDFQTRVMDITAGKGVDVVYDSVGKATFEPSLNCLKRRGMMVTYGNATGPVEPISPAILNQKGSLFLTRPKLMDYYSSPEELEEGSNLLFEQVLLGNIKININQRFALKDVKAAHDALEARQTTGSTILIP